MTMPTTAEPIQHALRIVILLDGDLEATNGWSQRSDTLIRAVVDTVQRVVGEALEGASFSAPTGYLQGTFFHQVVDVYARTTSANVARAHGDTSDIAGRLQRSLGSVFAHRTLVPVVQIQRIPGFGGVMVPQAYTNGPEPRPGFTVYTPTGVPTGASPVVERTTMFVQPAGGPPGPRFTPVLLLSALLGALVVTTGFLAVLLAQANRELKDARTELALANANLGARAGDLTTCRHHATELDEDYRELDADKQATENALQRKVDELVACATQRQCPKCEPSLVVCPPRRASDRLPPWQQ